MFILSFNNILKEPRSELHDFAIPDILCSILKKKDTGILNMQDYQQIKHCGVFVFAPRSVIFYTSQVFLHTQNVSQTMTIRARLFRERYLNLYLYVLHKALTAMLRQLRYWTIDWIFNLYFQNAQQDDKNKKLWTSHYLRTLRRLYFGIFIIPLILNNL